MILYPTDFLGSGNFPFVSYLLTSLYPQPTPRISWLHFVEAELQATIKMPAIVGPE